MPRFLVALAGIVFAVTLLTVQMGIFNGFKRSTTLLIEESKADIWIAQRDMAYLEVTLPLPYERLAQTRAIPGVAIAEPMILRTILWHSTHGGLNVGRVVGFNPDGRLFAPGDVPRSELDRLRESYTFLVDAAHLDLVDLRKPGDTGTIGLLPARLVGITHGTQPIVSATFFYMSLESANAYTPSALSFFSPTNAKPPPLTTGDSISFILVKAKNAAGVAALQRVLNRRLADAHAFTRAEMMARTRDYWVNRTSLGFVLFLGALLGIIVGIAVVGQILYTSVNEHLREYGTLKAIGVADRFLYVVIALQAVFMALIGYLPSLALSLLVASIAARRGVEVSITPGTAAIVLAAAVVMCVASAAFAVQRVTRADPAIVFRA